MVSENHQIPQLHSILSSLLLFLVLRACAVAHHSFLFIQQDHSVGNTSLAFQSKASANKYLAGISDIDVEISNNLMQSISSSMPFSPSLMTSPAGACWANSFAHNSLCVSCSPFFFLWKRSTGCTKGESAFHDLGAINIFSLGTELKNEFSFSEEGKCAWLLHKEFL